MTAISIEKLEKNFGKIKAVDNISFEVGRGEVFGFLGPNGAGKTTTIRCMMDFIRPSSGHVKILGLDSQEDSVKLKEKIGYLGANFRLYEYLTGQDHFDLIEKIRGKSKVLPELIEKLTFNPKIKVKNLSSGNKQKLGLILALMAEPEILILDEPTNALDPILQNAIYEILEQFKTKGTTIFFSSHNLSEVERICSKVGVIKEGKLITVENVDKIKRRKMHIINASFMDKVETKEFKAENISVVKEWENGISLKITDDINPTLKKICQYKVKDLEVTHASLEEIFLEFYGES